MVKRELLVVVALLATLLAGAEIPHSSPVLLWSGYDALSGRAAQSFAPLDAASLLGALDALSAVGTGAAAGPLASHLTPHPRHAAPEVVLLLLKDVLDTASFSRLVAEEPAPFAHLHRALHEAPASLVLPYAALTDNVFADVVEPLAAHIQRHYGSRAKFIATGSVEHVARSNGGAAVMVPLSQMEEYLKSADIFTNGVPDVVVLYLRETDLDAAAQNALMERVESVVSGATSGNYVALFAGNQQRLTQRGLAAIRQQPVLAAQADPDQDYSYFPTYVWAWLLVSLILAGLFGTAIYLTAGLQVPPKLLSMSSAINKKRQ